MNVATTIESLVNVLALVFENDFMPSGINQYHVSVIVDDNGL